MAITKRTWKGSATYRVRAFHQGRCIISRTFDRLVDARRFEAKTKAQLADGTYTDRSQADGMTLGDALDRYVNTISRHKKGRGYECDKSQAGIIKKYPIARFPISKIRPADVAVFRDARSKDVAAKTVCLGLGLISHVFTIARQEWNMDFLTNPVTVTRKPLLHGTARERRLEDGEEALLLDACDTYGGVIGNVVRLALETGMRRGEIAGIQWEDVDLERRVIYLYDTKNRDDRTVPLSSRATVLLDGMDRHDGQVFAITDAAISHAFSRVCRRAGIENLRFHDLRHEATSRFFEKGLNPMQVAAITGHKTLQMLKRYTHLRAEDLAKMLG